MTGELALALLLAAAIGLLLGLMGSGGSIVTLPILVYLAGIPARTAVGMTLVILGAAPRPRLTFLLSRTIVEYPSDFSISRGSPTALLPPNLY